MWCFFVTIVLQLLPDETCTFLYHCHQLVPVTPDQCSSNALSNRQRLHGLDRNVFVIPANSLYDSFLVAKRMSKSVK